MLALRGVLLAFAMSVACGEAAIAGAFSCDCTNGTHCQVSCGQSGAISCGDKSCASSCAASPKDGVLFAIVMAQSLAISRAGVEVAARVRTGDFKSEALNDLIRLVDQGELQALSSTDDAVVLSGPRRDGLQQTILIPRPFYQGRREWLEEIHRNRGLILDRLPPVPF